ncbi:MAG: flagellar biosynthesis protein FliQ [Myxococcota bacterium]|nr:flagellar biosynthesis protein FliQ [Myxococcota bacterium]
MGLDQIADTLRETVRVALLVSSPLLASAMLVGLLISIFQAATQINEQTLTFVPKIVVVLGLLAALFPWMMTVIRDFAFQLMASVAGGG